MWKSAATLCNLCAALDFPLWENLTCEHTIDFNWKSVCHCTQRKIFRCGFKIRIAEKKKSECHFLTRIPSWIFSLKLKIHDKSVSNPSQNSFRLGSHGGLSVRNGCGFRIQFCADYACFPPPILEIPRVSITKQRMVLLILDTETASKIYMTALLKWS